MHLYRCIRNSESWSIFSPSFYTSTVIIQRRSTVFSEFYAFIRMEHLYMVLTGSKAKEII